MYKVVVVGIADDRSTLSSAVAYGVGESDALEELLYFLIEGCTAYNDFVEVATECLDNLLLSSAMPTTTTLYKVHAASQ